MQIHNTPESRKTKFSLGQFSGWCSGLSWLLLFGVVFSDQLFDMGERGVEAALYLCIGPFFLLAMLGFVVSIITGNMARKRRNTQDEDDLDFASNGIKYGLIGIGFVLLSPLINLLIAPLGIKLFSITTLFGK
ncbi:MAG: hypothetical protein K8R77_01385 [Anaerolineaceae bacterium]|nr:hypothetical protein [Anaerolineaceae bacterium]